MLIRITFSLGSWLLILGSILLVLSSWLLILGSILLVLSSWLLVLSSLPSLSFRVLTRNPDTCDEQTEHILPFCILDSILLSLCHCANGSLSLTNLSIQIYNLPHNQFGRLQKNIMARMFSQNVFTVGPFCCKALQAIFPG